MSDPPPLPRNPNPSQVGLSDAVIRQLQGTRPWAIFFTVFSAIFALLLVIAFLMGFIFSLGTDSKTILAFYLVLGGAVLGSYLIFCFRLVQFVSALNGVLSVPSTDQLADTMNRQLRLWKAGVVFVLLSFLGGIVFGFCSAQGLLGPVRV